MDESFETWWRQSGWHRADPLTVRTPGYDAVKDAMYAAWCAARQALLEPPSLPPEEEAELEQARTELRW